MDDWSAIGDGIRAAFDRVADTRSLAREIRRTSEEIRERNSQLRQDLQTFETAMIRASRGLILRLCGYVVVQSRLRFELPSSLAGGGAARVPWGSVMRIAAASAVTLTRPATQTDDGPMLLLGY